MQALQSVEWLSFFRYVLWFTQWIGRIMRWGTGCSCHEQDLQAGAALKCVKKGGRLKSAFTWTSAALKAGLDEANAWTVNSFAGIIYATLAC